MIWQQRIQQALEQRQQSGGWRQRISNQQGSGRWLIHEGKRYLNFSGNDYLGLSQHPAVIQAWCDGARQYGIGSGGSGHVTGYHHVHQQLEQALADWLGYPKAILFISGFAANQAVITTFAQQGDSIFADKLSHSSLLDAAIHSPAQLRRFTHNDPSSLAQLLANPVNGGQLVVTEGVFSMDGDAAPLAEISTLTQQWKALLLVDDAHGIGVLGRQGRGSCALAGVRPDILVITFGKAFAVGGAAVLCSEPLAEYLIQFARHLIYSTSMSPAQALALHAALNVIRKEQSLRDQLYCHIRHFRAGVAHMTHILSSSDTAIQPVIIGDNLQAQRLAQHLRQQGIWLTAIRPPTVPPGTARLRITLSAAHQSEDINQLLEALAHVTNQ